MHTLTELRSGCWAGARSQRPGLSLVDEASVSLPSLPPRYALAAPQTVLFHRMVRCLITPHTLPLINIV